MPDLDRSSALVQQTMDQFDSPDMTVAAITRRCQRIASLRGDGVAVFWLSLEATDVGHLYANRSDDENARESLAERLIKGMGLEEVNTRWTAEYNEYSVRRLIDKEKQLRNLVSVQQLEEAIRNLREQEAAWLLPAPGGMNASGLSNYLVTQQKSRMGLVLARVPLENVLARIRDRLWEFLTETEHELTFGEATAETFDRLRAYVDRQLTTISPPALAQFQTAYRRIKDGGDEDRAHALTSCRRVLKTLADQLYPASAEPVLCSDGKTRVFTDPMFKNRLLQYVSETIGTHENGAVVQATLDDVDARLDALNSLASKGVHANVATYEVDTCVVQTYLVVADVLRIRERAAATATG